jgi:hypothetical protein
MSFKVGDLVSIISSLSASVHYKPPAMVIDAYESVPKIFLHNEPENKRWLEEEDIGSGRVYDIIHMGHIEEGVLGEWLRPWKDL